MRSTTFSTQRNQWRSDVISRRGFLGALTAIVAAPRALFARAPLTTLGLSESGTYQYNFTYYSAGGETPVTVGAAAVLNGRHWRDVYWQRNSPPHPDTDPQPKRDPHGE